MALKMAVSCVTGVLLLASTWSCSSTPSASSADAAQASAVNSGGTNAGSPNGNATYQKGISPTQPPSGFNKVPPTPITPSADSWCAAATQTRVVATATMAPLFGELCVNGKATTLLASILVSNAFAGTGSPALETITPIAESNSGSVTAFFGVGIKMPISAATEFTQVGPNQGSANTVIDEVTSQGGNPGNISSTPESSNADSGWVRGWTMQTQFTKSATIFLNINTDYATQMDQYSFGNGLYMYTSQIVKSVKTIQNYQILTASFDINGSGYLLSMVQMAVDDYGYPAQAIDAVSSTAGVLISAMYQGSAASGH